MKKLLCMVLTTIMAIALFVGCGDAVGDELVSYINEGRKPAQESLSKASEIATGIADLEDDAAIVDAISNELIPELDSAIATLEGLQLSEQEVIDLNAKYIEAYKEVRDAYAASAENLEAQDIDSFATNYQAALSAVEKIPTIEEELEKLCEEHSVTFSK